MIKRIISKEEQEKKHRRNMIVITVILGLIMLLSTLGYSFMSFDNSGSTGKTTKIDYNGITFQQTTSGTWSFAYGGRNYETLFNPTETTSIITNIKTTINNFYNKPLYFGINTPEDMQPNGNYEITKNLQGIYQKTQFSCIDSSCTENYPLKNCSENNVIIFKPAVSNISKITQQSNCIIITFASGQEEKSADAFLFNILNI